MKKSFLQKVFRKKTFLKQAFLRNCMVLGMSAALVMTAGAPVYAQDSGNPPTETDQARAGTVAQVGETAYTDLIAAAAAAIQSGQTLIMQEDVSTDQRINVTNGTLEMDLNGCTLTLTDRFAVENGTLIIDDTSADAAGKVTASNIATVVLNTGGIFILNNGTVEGGTHGVFANAGAKEIQIAGGKVAAVNAVCAVGNGTPQNMYVNISGGEILGQNAAVITNGSTDRGGVVMSISGGTITATDAESTAVYLPGILGETTITGGTITGATGVEIRAGELHISGEPVIIGNGAFKAQANASGATTTGVGVAVAQHGTKQPVDVAIEGNPQIGGYQAFYEHNPEKNPEEDVAKVEVSITGGVFASTAPASGGAALYSEDCTKFVSGGAFNTSVPDTICADGYMIPNVPDDNGNYTVMPKVFTMTFDSAGGSAVDPVTALFGNAFTAPTDPERAGYTFDGWYAAGADVPFDFTNTKAADHLTLTAHWGLLPPEVGITIEPEEPHVGDEAELTAHVSHKAADVKFVYQWYKDGEKIADADGQSYTASKAGEYKVLVTAMADGQSAEASASYELNVTDHEYDAVIVAPTCTEDGYTKHTCSICKASYTDEVTKAVGHKFENGVCTVCKAKDPQYKPEEEPKPTPKPNPTPKPEPNPDENPKPSPKPDFKPTPKPDPKPIVPGQNGNSGQNTPSAAKTGDETSTTLWGQIAVISGLAVIGAAAIRFRKKKLR